MVNVNWKCIQFQRIETDYLKKDLKCGNWVIQKHLNATCDF